MISLRNLFYGPPTPPDFDPNNPREVRRNFRLAVSNGVLFILADSLTDPTLVLVAFLSMLTDSPFLLGLIVPIQSAAWALPQIFVSGRLQSWPVKLDLYRRMSLVRIASWLMLALTINFVRDPHWAVLAFFVAFSIASLASGIAGLPFLEVISKTIPPNRRGEVFAWRLGLGGLLGIGGSFLVRWMVGENAPLPFPSNFGLLAFLFFVLSSISLVVYNQIREEPDRTPSPRRTTQQQVRAALAELRENANYRRLLVAQSLYTMAASATPFFAVYVQGTLGGSRDWVGVYLGVMMVTNLLANLLFGWLSRRAGNQRVLLVALSAGGLMSLAVLTLALLAGPLGLSPLAASIWLAPVFFLSALRNTGVAVSSSSLVMNIAPDEKRSLLIGFNQTFLGVVMLMNGLSGLVVGWLGLPVLVGFTLLAHLGALFLILGVHERH
ncbi:MAG TPA: MFS transporter [Anaerolineaceae bacterium]|nr:MFS transporter [Anaerolineaceae bacterium]